MSEIQIDNEPVVTDVSVDTPPAPSCTLIEFITLVHQIKIAAGASRGIPNGDTIALREIVDMIRHFEATH